MTKRLQSDVLTRLRTEGGAGLVAALAALLARTAPARLALVEHGVAVDDRDAVARAAHSLRSSAGNLGASELAQAAQALETLASDPAAWRDQVARQAAAKAVGDAWAAVADTVRRLAAAHAD